MSKSFNPERPAKRLRCDDRQVRTFYTSQPFFIQGPTAPVRMNKESEVECSHCGQQFGVHSWSAIYKELRRHVCAIPVVHPSIKIIFQVFKDGKYVRGSADALTVYSSDISFLKRQVVKMLETSKISYFSRKKRNP